MTERLRRIFELLTNLPRRLWELRRGRSLGVLSFFLGFAIALFLLNASLLRGYQIRQTKLQIVQLQKTLAEFNLDISYDNLHFNSWFMRPLLSADNFQIYNLSGTDLWRLTVPRLELKPRWFNSRIININFGNQQTWSWNNQEKPLNTQKAVIQLEAGDEGLQVVLAQIRHIEIKDFAKISELNLAGRRFLGDMTPSHRTAGFENHLELKDITLNGLLHYPLTSHINRIYLKTNFMGRIPAQMPLRLGLEEWLHQGGFVEIPNLVVNWPPLLLVGRGELNFDEKFTPSLRLETSSKALIKLLDDLQNHNTLDRKGVFVAKILLSNKAFKLNPADKDLAMITPIKYRDGKISVENITVRDFKIPVQPQ